MPTPGVIDRRNPVNWSHPLNRGLVAWWLGLPNQWGGGTLRDIAGRNHAALLPAAVGSGVDVSPPSSGTTYSCSVAGAGSSVSLTFSAFSPADGSAVTLTVGTSDGDIVIEVTRSGGNYFASFEAYGGVLSSGSAAGLAVPPTFLVTDVGGGSLALSLDPFSVGTTVPGSITSVTYSRSGGGTVTPARLLVTGSGVPTGATPVPWGPVPNGFAGPSLDGTSQYAQPAANGPLAITGPLSLIVRCRLRSLVPGNRPCLAGVGYDGSQTGYGLGFAQFGTSPTEGTGRLCFLTYPGSSSGSYSSADLSSRVGEWVTLGGSYDGSQWNTWIDGRLDRNAEGGTSAPAASAAPFAIGVQYSSGSPTRFAAADIAGVWVYNRGLSAGEMLAHHWQAVQGYPDTLRRYSPRAYSVPTSPPPPPPATGVFLPAFAPGWGFC